MASTAIVLCFIQNIFTPRISPALTNAKCKLASLLRNFCLEFLSRRAGVLTIIDIQRSLNYLCFFEFLFSKLNEMGVKRNLETAGIVEKSDKISEDEAALYDRQIRLWGMDCQKRLREAKILIIGMNGVGAEVAKNLALSGVKKIVLMDSAEVKASDNTAQFFVASAGSGQRAQASVPALQELNPNVEISVMTGDILSENENFDKDFHAIVATDSSVDFLIKVDQICRDHSIQFYCADTWGFYGYCFLDLQDHAFKCTTPVSRGSKSSPEGTKEQKLTVTREYTRKYCPLGPTLLAKVGEGLKRRVNKVFVLLHVVNHFREMFNRLPSPESHDEDVKELIKLKTIVCEKLGYDETKMSDDTLNSVFGELSPVCAAVGGILASEVIKGLSHNGLPVHNYFLFDGHESVGVNETIIVD